MNINGEKVHKKIDKAEENEGKENEEEEGEGQDTTNSLAEK